MLIFFNIEPRLRKVDDREINGWARKNIMSSWHFYRKSIDVLRKRINTFYVDRWTEKWHRYFFLLWNEMFNQQKKRYFSEKFVGSNKLIYSEVRKRLIYRMFYFFHIFISNGVCFTRTTKTIVLLNLTANFIN